MPGEPKPAEPSRLKRWQAELMRYGWVGLGIHYLGFGVTIGTFYAVLSAGLQDRIPWLADRVGEDTALLAGSYALTKALTLPRLAVTLAVTPPVARWLGKAPAAS